MEFHINSLVVRLLIAISTVSHVEASYYFSPSGDDSRSPIQAQNISTPWKSLNMLETIILKPGDHVFLERGGTWNTPLKILQSGTPFERIVIEPYGNSVSPPEIRGTKTVKGKYENGKNRASMDGLIKGAFINNTPVQLARYPDTGWIYGKLDGDSVIVVPSLSGSDWTGASVNVIAVSWIMENRMIKKGDGGRLILDRGLSYKSDTVQIFLSNHKSAFGSSKSWYQDIPNGTVYWNSIDSLIELSVDSIGIDLSSSEYITIRGIRLFGFTGQGISSKGNGVTIDGCDIQFPGQIGLKLNGRNALARNNSIRGAGFIGILSTNTRAAIRANSLTRIGYLYWLGPDGMTLPSIGGGGGGIIITGDSSYSIRNNLDSIGYNGITFNGRFSVIDSNTIDHACQTTTDGGGIYGWGKNANLSGTFGSLIRHNIVRNVSRRWSHGIYLDESSHGIRVDSNILYKNTTSGLFIHNGYNILARGNIVVGQDIQFYYQNDNINQPMTGISIDGNTSVSGLGQVFQYSTGLKGASMPEVQYSKNLACIDYKFIAACSTGTTELWKRDRIFDTITVKSISTKFRMGSYIDTTEWEFWPASVRIMKDLNNPVNSHPSLRFECYGNDNCKNGTLVTNNQFSVMNGNYYLLKFKALSTKPQKIRAFLKQASLPNNDLAIPTVFAFDTIAKDYSYIFQATMSDSLGRLQLQISDTSFVTWLSDFQLYEIPATVFDSLPSSMVLANSTNNLLNYSLIGEWLNPIGQQESSVALRPYSGVVLFPFSRSWNIIPTQFQKQNQIRVFRLGNRYIFQGLQGATDIFDIRGIRVDRILSDDYGNAEWSSTKNFGQLYIRSGKDTQSFILKQ